MRFLIIGGSGHAGQLVIKEAIEKSHQVVALVRSKSALQERPGLTIVVGSPLNKDDIEKAIAVSKAPIDAVLVTLGARRVSNPFAATDPITSPPFLMADSVRNTIAAMQGAYPPLKKIVYLSSVGTGDSWSSLNWFLRLTFTYTNMRYIKKDHDAVDRELRNAEGIAFVQVRPWMFTTGEAAKVKIYDDDGRGAGFMSTIALANVARFMVEAAETSKYDGKSPVIAN